MSKKYRSDAMAAIHEMMEDLHDGGVIDKKTMAIRSSVPYAHPAVEAERN